MVWELTHYLRTGNARLNMKKPRTASRHTGPIVFFRLLFFGSVPFRNELHQLVVFLIGFLKLVAQ